MTTKDIGSEVRKGIRENDLKELLRELNQKVDYIIEILREEELRYPYNQSFLDTYQNNRNNNR